RALGVTLNLQNPCQALAAVLEQERAAIFRIEATYRELGPQRLPGPMWGVTMAVDADTCQRLAIRPLYADLESLAPVEYDIAGHRFGPNGGIDFLPRLGAVSGYPPEEIARVHSQKHERTRRRAGRVVALAFFEFYLMGANAAPIAFVLHLGGSAQK